MKGFKKDGKFRPTGNKSKSPLKKSDIRKDDTLDWMKPENVKKTMDNIALRSLRIKNHQDPNTGESLKPHEDDEWWIKNTGHPARETNREGYNFDDRGRRSIVTEKQKERAREVIPFLKFASDPYHSKKILCGQVMCENQAESGMPNAIAQFQIEYVDESGHTDGLLYHKEGDYVCATCLNTVEFHSMQWEEDNKDIENPDSEDYETTSVADEMPDFKDPIYKHPFEEKLFYGDITMDYNPNGFKLTGDYDP